jgi:hypothetical protein
MAKSILGSGCSCVDCGAELTEDEVRLAYRLKTSQPRCSVCGGYSVEAAYPTPERMQAQEDFKTWRIAERALEILH